MGGIIQRLEFGEKCISEDDQTLQKSIRHTQVTKPQGVEYKQKVLDCQEFLRSGDSYELCLTDQTDIILPAVKYAIHDFLITEISILTESLCSGKPPSRWSVYKRLRKSEHEATSLQPQLVFTDCNNHSESRTVRYIS